MMESDSESGLLFNLTNEEKKPSSRNKDQDQVKQLPVNKSSQDGSYLNIGSKNDSNLQQSPSKHTAKKQKNIGLLNKSSIEHKTSSLFKSNPEIPVLRVDRNKGVSEPLFSQKTFEDLNLHPHLVSCLKSRLEVVKLTKVQEKTIPVLLEGRDTLVKSCTGSGKTLAYAVPIVQKLQDISPKIKRCDGIFSLIIVPTRELALQCFECFSTLTKSFTWIVPGYLIGGEKKKSEKARLRKGINILICTPGRLLDHLESTACLSLEKINWLVIDEADKLLEQGFEEAVTKIVLKCQNSRQTVMLSATLSQGVERLAGISLRDPVHVDVASETGSANKEFEDFALPRNLKQSVVVVPAKLRLTVMSGFIVDQYLHDRCKGLIFMCSQSSVDFHHSILSSVLAPLLKGKGLKCKIFRLHGNMKQEERTEIFNSFRSKKEGILLCTDVAARGLDLPHVDWIMQYSVPSSVEIYVHRVGRTARIGKSGTALLFLLPSESKFSDLLSQNKIEFEEIEANKFLQSLLPISDSLTIRSNVSAEDCATALQTHFEKEVYKEDDLHKSATEAFTSYVQSYASYPKHIRDVLPFKALHLGHVAKSFCLREAPSELGCKIPNMRHHSKPSNARHHPKSANGVKMKHHLKPKRDNEDRVPLKRKRAVIVSEFDSGLSVLKHSHAPKRRKTK